jgi:hypothetical protein
MMIQKKSTHFFPTDDAICDVRKKPVSAEKECASFSMSEINDSS